MQYYFPSCCSQKITGISPASLQKYPLSRHLLKTTRSRSCALRQGHHLLLENRASARAQHRHSLCGPADSDSVIERRIRSRLLACRLAPASPPETPQQHPSWTATAARSPSEIRSLGLIHLPAITLASELLQRKFPRSRVRLRGALESLLARSYIARISPSSTRLGLELLSVLAVDL
jgi:hypothetical protein